MFHARLPAVYRNRVSQKAAWEHHHADQMRQVEWLLCEICEAFDFPTDSRYQFAPEDQLFEIYRSRYPRWKFWALGDSLELESVAMEVEKRLGPCGSELFTLSLGEIVSRADASERGSG